ncbi:MAG TPA: glycosyltransferase family 4 protein [Polyangia bacterium]|nr:glycosyltransferase family 4 protein [Polyangia bacterium]
MRVGVVTTSYPRGPGDAAGAFVADRVEALLADGHDVDVIAAGAPSRTSAVSRGGRLTITRLPAHVGDGPDLFAGAGAPETLEAGAAAAWLGAARFSAALAAEVRARASGWARVESHWLAPCALAVAAGAPALAHRATAHSGDVALLERVPFGRTLARALVASGATLVFVSEALRRRFSALVGSHIEVGDVERLRVPALFTRASRPDRAMRAALGLSSPTVVAVGRLVPIKGFDLLVRACASTEGGRVPLVIVGDGPERARLRRLADGLGVDLKTPGHVARAEVGAWLRAADLYAQPSRVLPNGRTEGLPVATLEALATGLPAVVSDSGGLGELAAVDSSVEVVPAGDVPALARAVRRGLGLARAA